MMDGPAEVLPRFVDLAMNMAEGVSAGLSLYEESSEPKVFRWCYLRGTLATFEGATTPRDFSPCGITLDEMRPILSRHPERYYNWIAEANIVVPEVLLVPLYRGNDEPLGTLWIVSDQIGHFNAGHARSISEACLVRTALRFTCCSNWIRVKASARLSRGSCQGNEPSGQEPVRHRRWLDSVKRQGRLEQRGVGASVVGSESRFGRCS